MSYEVLVYCDGRPLRAMTEPSHPERRAYVARFEYHAAGEHRLALPAHGPGLCLPGCVTDEDMWVPLPWSRRRYNAQRSADVEVSEPPVCETIGEDGTPLDVESIVSAGDMERLSGSHLKATLRCSVCGLDLQMRMDRLSPYLDALRHAGWGEVSLPAIGAIVSQ